MKRVYTLKDIEGLKAAGGSIPADAILTPQAKEALRDGLVSVATGAAPAQNKGGDPYPVPDKEIYWTPGSDPKTPEEIQKFFFSPKMQALKALIVDLGLRSYNKNYNDGNGGNFSVRVGENLVLCTPTMISKGRMSVEDMCLVDMEGKQLAGNRKRTSEVLAHIAIMKRQPKAKACCHAHPPHATAFAITGKTPPRCVNPETEIFIAQVGIADYGTPGTQAMADKVGEVGKDHDCVFMLNHGVITWANEIETAFWKMENVEAHCYTSMLAFQIGGPRQFSDADAEKLMEIRRALGMIDQPKNDKFRECNLCDTPDELRPGCVCSSIAQTDVKGTPPNAGFDSKAEDIVAKITQMIISELNK